MTAMSAMKAVANPVGLAPWVEFWFHHPRVIFQRTFGAGGKNFSNGSGDPGVLKLAPRVDDRNRLVGYTVISDGTNLPLGWNGVTLVPRGTRAPDANGVVLPPYVDTPDCNMKYEAGFKDFVTDLHQDTSDFQRLEGFFPVFDDSTNTFNIDRIRLVNVPGIVDGTKDHSLAILTLLDGTAGKQNGGGNGPPDP